MKTLIEVLREHLTGLTVEKATAKVRGDGWKLRIVEKDGERCMGTQDVDMSRINIKVVDGTVSEVRSVG